MFYRSLSVLCPLRLPVIIKVLSYLILHLGRYEWLTYVAYVYEAIYTHGHTEFW